MIIFANRKQLVRSLYKDARFERMLYIGADVRRPTDYRTIRRIAAYIHVIEAWEPTVEVLRNSRLYDEVEHADIASYEVPSTYDVIVWWHGPEHAAKADAVKILKHLPRCAPVVWIATPWGINEQGAIRGNPFNVHKSTWYPEDFELLGYATGVCGVKNRLRSQLVGWICNEARSE